MICNHCKNPIDAGDEMKLHNGASLPETVCVDCWIQSILPFDCIQCLAEVGTA